MKGEDRISNGDKRRDDTPGETKRGGKKRERREDKKKVIFMCDTMKEKLKSGGRAEMVV